MICVPALLKLSRGHLLFWLGRRRSRLGVMGISSPWASNRRGGLGTLLRRLLPESRRTRFMFLSPLERLLLWRSSCWLVTAPDSTSARTPEDSPPLPPTYFFGRFSRLRR